MSPLNNDRNAIPVVVLSIVIFGIYVPALFNGFIINFDDQAYVTGNPPVRTGLTISSVVWAFTTVHSYNWHPLTWISHMLDVQLFGLEPMGHHLINILFHVANCLLLFRILKKLTAAHWPSLFVAAFFAVHPLRVESVAWIAERKDVLSSFFGFLAILVYVDYTKTFKPIKYVLLLCFFTLSLMAKPMFVTLPFMLLLLDYWPLSRWPSLASHPENTKPSRCNPAFRLIVEKLPLFLLTIASGAATYYVQEKAGSFNLDTPLSLNIGNAIISYVKYIAKMFWPHPLAAIYPFDPAEINYFNLLASCAFLLAVSFFALWQRRRRPFLLVGWLWYLGTLIPVIGVVRIGDHAIADRYSYVPLIGLTVILVWFAKELIQRLEVDRKVVISVSVVVLAIFSVITLKQIKYWKNDVVLFEHAIAVTNHNAPAHRRLGLAYGSRMNVEKATFHRKTARLLHYQYLSTIRPGNAEIRYLLGNSYIELQRFDEAIAEYVRSINLDNKNSKAYNNLGIAYGSKGKIIEARQAFTQARAIDPNNREVSYNLEKIEKMLKVRD